MVSRALIVGVLLAVAGPAQEPGEDPYAALATGTPPAIEVARRRLVTDEPVGLRVDVLHSLLRNVEPQRRSAALSILLRHDRLDEAARAALTADPEPAVRRLLIESGDAAAVRKALAAEAVSELRVLAFHRLCDLGVADGDEYIEAVCDPDESLRRAAARRLVFTVVPLPTERFPALSADGRRAVLEALAMRPRRAATSWARTLRANLGLDAAEAVLVRLALTPDDWQREDALVVLDALASDDPHARGFALDAAELMPAALADRLVAEVHARVLDGGDVDGLIHALDQVSPKGARHLAGLARVLPPESRERIVEWLMSRRSPVVDALVEDALAGRAPAEPFILRQASKELLSHPEPNAAMRALLTDVAQPPSVRLAAFDALVGGGQFRPELLSFALEPDGDLLHCVRRILSLPPDELPDSAWTELLELQEPRVARMVLARMAEAPRLERSAERLRILTAADGPIAIAAAEVCLRAGSEDLAMEVWADLSPERRRRLALAFRDRRDPFALELLRAEPVTDDAFGLLEARMALGDREAFDVVLDDPRAWPSRWLVRVRGIAPSLLTAEDLAIVSQHLFGEEALASVPHRVELIAWVGARPDLDPVELLRKARARGEPEEQDVALRGLLASEHEGSAIRAELGARLAAGLDDAQKSVAYEAAGSLSPPLDADGAAFVSRLGLVEPLAHPLEEVGDPLGRAAMQNLIWQQLGRDPTDAGARALAAAVDESLASTDACVASRRRLGEMLALFARTEATRGLMAPALARAVLATPDLDSEHVGGARLIQAEQAEAAGEWQVAANAYQDAWRALLSRPIDPVQLRGFVGDGYRATGEIWPAWLTGRAELCRARACRAAGDEEGARAALARAAELAEGDRATEQAVEDFRQEIER